MRKIGSMFLLFISMATCLWAAEPEFSANISMRTGKENMSGRVYYSQKKMRYELSMGVSITHLDEGVTYILLPSQKIYMKQSIEADAVAKMGAVSGGEVERVSLGKETVNGISAEKFRITYSGKDGGMTVLQWQDSGGFPIKVEDVNGAWAVEYSDLKPGSQPNSLFTVPSDYEVFETPKMPANLQSMVGAGGGMDIESLKKMAEKMQSGLGSGDEENGQ